MPYRYQMKIKNQYGDNGWWKKIGDTMCHYFVQRLPLCGTGKFNNPNLGLGTKNYRDLCCKTCSKVRLNQLKARMNSHAMNVLLDASGLLQPKSHSPKKPQ